MRAVTALLAAVVITAAGVLPAAPVQAAVKKGTASAFQPYEACPSKCGALRVKGTSLVDKKGRKVQLRGVSTHGLAWYPGYVNQKFFKELKKKWNANAVRLAMYTAEYGGYCTGGNKKELKNLIKQGVKYAKKADMYAIVDWHILSDQNPNTYKKDARKFFKEISKSLKSYNNVIYEICNEPNGSTSWKDIKKYAKAIIPVIRANDRDAVIIVGTPNWSQYVDEAAKSPIKGYKNIMYALHFYAGTHKDDLRNKMVSAVGNGLPVFVSEFGICDASGNGAVDKASANTWVSEMNKYGISYVCWNLSNKDESSALIKSSCSKTSGFVKSDLSEEGRWLIKTLSAKGFSGKTVKAAASSQKTAVKGPLAKSGKSGTLSFKAVVSDSWESGGKTYYKYDVTVTNTSKNAVDGCNISIPVSKKVNVSNLWCALKVSSTSSALKLRNESYNGHIEAGGSVTGVGMIVY